MLGGTRTAAAGPKAGTTAGRVARARGELAALEPLIQAHVDRATAHTQTLDACLRAIEGRVTALGADCASSAAAVAGTEQAVASLVATLHAEREALATARALAVQSGRAAAAATAAPPYVHGGGAAAAHLGGALYFVGGVAVGALLFMLRNKR